MRITNNDVFNPSQIFGDTAPHILEGTSAPDTSDFFTKRPVGTLYLRHIANGHVQTYQKICDNDLAGDWRCIAAVISQRVSIADFTDGGGASGTLNLSNDIPIGAIVDPISVMDVTGFAGDVSAVLLVGESGDTDRYMTGTPSVFATATAVNAGAPSGVIHHTAAKTPLLTLTSATDIGLVITNGAGRLTVSIPYHF